jgi:hypothetical protein
VGDCRDAGEEPARPEPPPSMQSLAAHGKGRNQADRREDEVIYTSPTRLELVQGAGSLCTGEAQVREGPREGKRIPHALSPPPSHAGDKVTKTPPTRGAWWGGFAAAAEGVVSWLEA